MTFGGYEYGPDDADESDSDEQTVVMYPDDHPASVSQCDHPNCTGGTPEPDQRICEECTEIMRYGTADECGHCGATISS